jgi:hypothetical protein
MTTMTYGNTMEIWVDVDGLIRYAQIYALEGRFTLAY